jgi:hypothetical protein
MSSGTRSKASSNGRTRTRRRDDRQRRGIVRVAAVGDFHCGE